MTKGGSFRKWYGNNDYIILWQANGRALKNFSGSVIRNEQYYFKEGGSGTLLVPSSLAYGRFGSQSIPGGAVLIFDVNLKSVN